MHSFSPSLFAEQHGGYQCAGTAGSLACQTDATPAGHALLLTRPLDIEGSTEDLAPLAYWLGHTGVAADNLVQLRQLMSSLASGVRR